MSSVYKPGYLEVIFGCMKSGKSEQFINRFKKLAHSKCKTLIFKPAVNVREPGIATRAHDITLNAFVIDENRPEDIIRYLMENKGTQFQIIGIDEAQFFDIKLVEIVDNLLRNDYHLIISGLLLSFKAEPFGPMPYLVGRAHEITKLTAICEYKDCSRIATLTQRLINNEPANYNSPLVLIEGSGQTERYEPRCIHHYILPRNHPKE